MSVSAEPAAGGRTASRPRLPDFFIVGHPKCGTTALWEMLRAHPQIYMPAIKELRFFATDMHFHHGTSAQPQLPHTLKQYASLFEPAGPLRRAGEASPLYLMSRNAAARIADVQPAARAIAILREPASFVRSLHLQWVRSHFETEKNLRKAIALEPARRQGRRVPRGPLYRPQTLLYSDLVRYVEQLRRYHAALPREQVLVLIYEDFRGDNEATLRRVLRFLDVDEGSSVDRTLPVDATAPAGPTPVNPTVHMRFQGLDRMVHAASVGRAPVWKAVNAGAKALAPRRLRRRALAATRRRIVYGDPPPPDEQLMAELRRRYRPEVVALSEYLNRDLVKLWGYDKLP